MPLNLEVFGTSLQLCIRHYKEQESVPSSYQKNLYIHLHS